MVRASMEESLVQILSPKRRIDVLRDSMSAREQGRPYVVTFCGVNGVGKSTNLAKVKKKIERVASFATALSWFHRSMLKFYICLLYMYFKTFLSQHRFGCLHRIMLILQQH